MRTQLLFLSFLFVLFFNSEQLFAQFVTTGTATTNNLFTGGSVSIGTTTTPVFGTNKFIVTGNSLFSGDVITTSSFGSQGSSPLFFKIGNTLAGRVSFYLYGNTSFGYNAFPAQDGLEPNNTHNTAIGNYSLFSNISGNGNTATGASSLRSNISGSANSAFGSFTLNNNTTGQQNSAFGQSSLSSNLSGHHNNSFGNNSLNNNTIGFSNNAFGSQSLLGNTTGNSNNAFGFASLSSGTTGNSNSAFGTQSLYSLTAGDSNNAFGNYSLEKITTGYYNTAVGDNSGRYLTSGSNNVFLGRNTQPNISNTSSNQLNIGNWIYGNNGDIGIGVLAPSNKFEIKSSITSPSPSGLRFTNLNNTSVSTTNPTNKILSVNATGDVVLVDDKTGVSTATTNQLNVVGSTLTSSVNGVSSSVILPSTSSANSWLLAGNALTSGSEFIGTINQFPLNFNVGNLQRLQITNTGRFHVSNTSGGNTNLFFGQNAGNEVMSGYGNIGVGNRALFENLTGHSNVALGDQTLSSNTLGRFNSAFGYRSLFNNTTGEANIGLGTQSLYSNVSGNNNTASGFNSLASNSAGNNNTAYGMGSLGSMISGSNNVAFGSSSLLTISTGDNNVAIGNRSGYNLHNGINNIFIGNNVQPLNSSVDNYLNIGNKIYGTQVANNIKIGFGISDPQANFHTSGSVRLQNLSYSSTLPTNILGTDGLGNVYNFNPNLLGSGNNVNIYNSDGNLKTNRYVYLDNFNLNFLTAGKIGVGTDNLFSKFTIADDTNKLFTDIEPAVTDVNALFEIKSNTGKGGQANKFNISQFKEYTWMQSSLYNDKPYTLSINPLGGNVGIGVLDATAQLHTIKSVRFEGLPFQKKPNAILGTDIDGNVYNYDPTQFGNGGTSSDAWLLNGNLATNPGTGLGQNFVGTIDNKDLVFGVNSDEKLRITQTGRLKFYNSDAFPIYNNNIYLGGGNDNVTSLQDNINWANVAVGLGALSTNITGYANTATGFNSLGSNSTGNLNSAYGINSLQKHSNGDANVSVGHNSMRENTSGSQNSALGNAALFNNQSGYNNTAVGSYAGSNLLQGDNNLFIGFATQATTANVSNELNIGNWIFGKNGQIAIGSFSNLPQSFITNNDYQLIVKKGIRTEKVRVDIASVKNWADYVFEKEYKLMPLHELEQFIYKNGHLPNIPKAEDVVKDGLDLGAMDAKLLEKIEELTLYTIELNTKNEELEKTKIEQNKLIQNLADRLEKLEKKDKH